MECAVYVNDVMLWDGHLVGSGPSGRMLSKFASLFSSLYYVQVGDALDFEMPRRMGVCVCMG